MSTPTAESQKAIYALTAIADLKPAEYNPRKITQKELAKLADSIKTHGFVEPIVVNKDNTIIGGHQRLKAAVSLGMTHLPTMTIDIPKEQEKALNLALNRIKGEWDEAMLARLIAGLDEATRKMTGFEQEEIAQIMKALDSSEAKKSFLADRFLIPPMSILDARQGYWQERKRKWLALGLKSEEGRGENLLKFSETVQNKKPSNKGLTFGESELWEQSGTSIFDPVLCEIAYRWFCPPSARILDPFAGGSVRGITAALLGHDYTGIELRKEQVEANRIQAEIITPDEHHLEWHVGDSVEMDKVLGEAPPFDFIFSCPPYGDLEKYSDDPADISNMGYDEFMLAYETIIEKSVARLRDNRFACFVVGDIRDENGNYRNFVSDTIAAFVHAGAHLYNEAILITAYGSLPIRAGKQFETSRKLGKTHQNLLVFQKGDPAATCAIMAPYFGDHRQLAEHHQKVLVFVKGDAKQGTADLGQVPVDSESFIINSISPEA